MNHSWWAMIVLMVVSGMIFACLIFSYLFLWLVNPGAWPPGRSLAAKPDMAVAAAALYVGERSCRAASRMLRGDDRRAARARCRS